MKKSKLLTLLLASAMSLTLLTACGGSSETEAPADTTEATEAGGEATEATGEETDASEESVDDVKSFVDDDTLVVGAPELNGSYINGFGNSTYDVWIKRLIGNYDGILSYGTYYPNDSNEWNVNKTVVDGEPEVTENEDGTKSYTFKINDGLVWNDETPITAKDYVFEVLFHAGPDWSTSGANNSAAYESLLGFNEYNSGESDEFPGIELIDEKTFKVTIKAEKVPYFYEVAFANIKPSPMHRYAPNLDVEGSKLIVAEGYEVTDEDKATLAENQGLAVDSAKENYDAAVAGVLEAEEAEITQEDIDKVLEGDYKATLEEYNKQAEAGEETTLNPDMAGIIEAKIALDEAEALLAGYQDGSIELDAKDLLLASAVNDVVYNYRFNPDVTCGPYNFVSYENNMVKVSLNPLYVGNAEGDKPTIGNIVVQIINPKLNVDLAIAGTIDFVSGETEGEKIDKARQSDDLNFNEYPRNGYGVIQILCDIGATQHKGVRQAIAYSLDRNEFVQNIQGGYGVVVNGAYGLAEFEYIEKGSEFEAQANNYTLNAEAANAALDTTPYLYEADGTTKWDPAKAQAAYEADKENFDYWRHDEEGNRLRVIHDGSTNNEVSDLISVQLPDNTKKVGMQYIFNPVPFNTLLDHFYYPNAADPDAASVFNMGTGFDSLHDNYYQYHSSQIGVGDNTNRLADPEVDKILEDARHVDPSDKENWLNGWLQFNLWYNDNLPNIPLYANQYHDIYGTRVENVTTTPFHDWSLRICDITLAK